MNGHLAQRLDELMLHLGVPDTAQLPEPGKVPKARMFEHASLTPANRRFLDQHIESIWLCAALKPQRTRYTAVDAGSAYAPEVLVIAVELRAAAGANPSLARVAKLMHPTMPYPVVLVLCMEQQLQLSFLALRRDARVADRYVWDAEPVYLAAALDADWGDEATRERWQRSAALSTDLHSLYLGWARVPLLTAIEALIGTALPLTAEYWTVAEAHQHLGKLRTLEKQRSTLLGSIRTEKQLNRRVDLNLRQQKLQREHADYIRHLTNIT